MTTLEYMKEHPDENLSWCKPYTNKSGDSFLILCDSGIAAIEYPKDICVSWDGTMDDSTMEMFARYVNSDYDFYDGWSDKEIALEVMHEVGCASCPFKMDCEAMCEEIKEEYR